MADTQKTALNGEFKGTVKAQIQATSESVQYIRQRLDTMPCHEHLERLTALETRMKMYAGVFGGAWGLIAAAIMIAIRWILDR